MNKDQLFSDASFVNWALGESENDSTYWEQYLSDHPELADQIMEARGMLIAEKMNLSGVNLNREWSNIAQRIGHSERNQRRKKGLIGVSMAALLVFLILGVRSYFTTPSTPVKMDQIVVTQPGEIRTVVLPDRSTITLNGRSSIRYPSNLDQLDTRRVILDGEAFFEVTKNKTEFVVQLPEGQVTVLGTQFNVQTRTPRARVSLLEGKVEVQSNNGGEVLLHPGQTAILDRNIMVRDEDVAALASWKDGIWSFNKTPLSDLMDRLHNDFGLQVELADQSLLSRKISGNLSTRDLSVLYKAIETMMNVRIDQQPRGIIIRNK
ncbi:MAG: FecR domain-containing protein [Saprospiraceae bacterium]|nr:FecR domain-containing protein [Saprospiraceae bacterium]